MMKPLPAASRRNRGAAAHKSGGEAEGWAVFFLRCKGYRILGRRLRTPFGEVDILAAKRGALIAVEVKSRTRLGAAHESISIQQRKRLIKAAQHLAGLSKTRFSSIRCDAFLFGAGGWPRHIKNAFEE